MTQIKLGEMVRVSDPCYNDDVWCKTKLTNVKEGMYNVYVEHTQLDGWGTRVSKLEVVHEDYLVLRHNDNNWEEHSEVGVDSGQCGIFCESSYRNDVIAESIHNGNGIRFDSFGDGDKWYEKMCRFTLNNKEHWGSYDSGVVTSSGYGDGGYPLEIIENDGGQIVGMRITYIFDEEGEDGEICGVCGGDMDDSECEYCKNELDEK